MLMYCFLYILLLTTALPQRSHVIWPKHLSRAHKWLKNLHNIEVYNKVTSPKRVKKTTGSVVGSGRNNKLEVHKKDESYKNETIEYTRNGSINTPVTFLRECLCAHNYKRRLHDVPRLRWSAELAKEAQNRADELASVNISIESEIVNKDENIYVDRIVDLSTSCPRAVEFWYAESEKYNYIQNDLSNDTENFTRLLWRSSSQIGVGRAISGSGNVIVVAKYRPAGNIQGKFKTNIKKMIMQDDSSNLEIACSANNMDQTVWPGFRTSLPRQNEGSFLESSNIHGDFQNPPSTTSDFPDLPNVAGSSPGPPGTSAGQSRTDGNSIGSFGTSENVGGPPGTSGNAVGHPNISSNSGGRPGGSVNSGVSPDSSDNSEGPLGSPDNSVGPRPGNLGGLPDSSGNSEGPPGSSSVGGPPGNSANLGGPPGSSGVSGGSSANSGNSESSAGSSGNSESSPGSSGDSESSAGSSGVSGGSSASSNNSEGPPGSSGNSESSAGSSGNAEGPPGPGSSDNSKGPPGGPPGSSDNSKGPLGNSANLGGPSGSTGVSGGSSASSNNSEGPPSSSGNSESSAGSSGNAEGPPGGPPGSSDNSKGPPGGPPGSSDNSKGPLGNSANLGGPSGSTGVSGSSSASSGKSESSAGSSGNSEGPPGSSGNSEGLPGNSEGSAGSSGNSEGPPGSSGNSEGPPGSSGNSEGSAGSSGNSEGPPGSSGNSEGPPGSSGNSEGPPGSSDNSETSAGSSGNLEGSPNISVSSQGPPPNVPKQPISPNTPIKPISTIHQPIVPRPTTQSTQRINSSTTNQPIKASTTSPNQSGTPAYQPIPIFYLPQKPTIPEILGRSFKVSMVLPQQPFGDDLLRTNSLIFHQLKDALEQAIRNLYADNSHFMDVQVIEFRFVIGMNGWPSNSNYTLHCHWSAFKTTTGHFRAINKGLVSRSNIPTTKMNKGYGELVTVIIIKLNFNQVMKGHLVLLSRQLDSGVLGSVVVRRTLFAARTDKDSCKSSCKKPNICFPSCTVVCCLPDDARQIVQRNAAGKKVPAWLRRYTRPAGT